MSTPMEDVYNFYEYWVQVLMCNLDDVLAYYYIVLIDFSHILKWVEFIVIIISSHI